LIDTTDSPELVRFGDLTIDHFRRHPVWIQCHGTDSHEPWHDDVDEDAFRPWRGTLPADPSEGMLLVAATLTLNDGTTLDGFITPAFLKDQDRPDVLGTVQPQMFLPSGKLAGFWEGMFARPAAERAALYTDLSRPPERVFPIRFEAYPGLATGVVTGRIDGFYWQPKLRGTPSISRT
jgi:hypothetical protein